MRSPSARSRCRGDGRVPRARAVGARGQRRARRGDRVRADGRRDRFRGRAALPGRAGGRGAARADRGGSRARLCGRRLAGQPAPADGARASRRPRSRPSPEVSPDDVWPLREEWMRSEPWGDDDAVAAMLRWERERAQLTGARAFCAFAEGARSRCACCSRGPRRRGRARLHEPVATRPRPRLRGRRARGRTRPASSSRSSSPTRTAPPSTSTRGSGSAARWVVYRFLRARTTSVTGST